MLSTLLFRRTKCGKPIHEGEDDEVDYGLSLQQNIYTDIDIFTKPFQ